MFKFENFKKSPKEKAQTIALEIKAEKDPAKKAKLIRDLNLEISRWKTVLSRAELVNPVIIKQIDDLIASTEIFTDEERDTFADHNAIIAGMAIKVKEIEPANRFQPPWGNQENEKSPEKEKNFNRMEIYKQYTLLAFHGNAQYYVSGSGEFLDLYGFHNVFNFLRSVFNDKDSLDSKTIVQIFNECFVNKTEHGYDMYMGLVSDEKFKVESLSIETDGSLLVKYTDLSTKKPNTLNIASDEIEVFLNSDKIYIEYQKPSTAVPEGLEPLNDKDPRFPGFALARSLPGNPPIFTEPEKIDLKGEAVLNHNNVIGVWNNPEYLEMVVNVDGEPKILKYLASAILANDGLKEKIIADYLVAHEKDAAFSEGFKQNGKTTAIEVYLQQILDAKKGDYVLKGGWFGETGFWTWAEIFDDAIREFLNNSSTDPKDVDLLKNHGLTPSPVAPSSPDTSLAAEQMEAIDLIKKEVIKSTVYGDFNLSEDAASQILLEIEKSTKLKSKYIGTDNKIKVADLINRITWIIDNYLAEPTVLSDNSIIFNDGAIINIVTNL